MNRKFYLYIHEKGWYPAYTEYNRIFNQDFVGKLNLLINESINRFNPGTAIITDGFVLRNHEKHEYYYEDFHNEYYISDNVLKLSYEFPNHIFELYDVNNMKYVINNGKTKYFPAKVVYIHRS